MGVELIWKRRGCRMIVGVWFKSRYWCEKWFADFLSKINYDMVDRVIRSKV